MQIQIELTLILRLEVNNGQLIQDSDIRQSVFNINIIHEASPTDNHITLSLGISHVIPDPAKSPNLLTHYADKALYRAKAKGRNCLESQQVILE